MTGAGRLLLVGWLTMLGGVVPSWAVTLVADAHVNKALPAVNSGAISNLYVGAGYTSLLQFDLGVLPGGTTAAQVSKAILRVYCNRMDAAGVVSVQPVQAGWGEYSVTYGTLPMMGSATQTFSVTQAGAYLAVDVTALVQGWVSAPVMNFGVALTADTAAVQFDSKENDLSGHSAELDVVLVSQGPVGPQGIQGPVGLTGPVGAAGAIGPQGPAGQPGATGPTGLQGPPVAFAGAWLAGSSYAVGDAVSYAGSSYIARLANQGRAPDLSLAYWGLLAQAGVAGPTGATGAQGLQGPIGLTGPAGAPGPTGPVGAAGATGAAGPAGAAGVTGPAGPAGGAGATGPAGLSYRGVYASGMNYGLNDGVTFQGSSYISLLASNLGNTPGMSPPQWGLLAAQGATGPAGLVGAAGAVGPAGPAGAAGATGATGAAGVPGVVYRGTWNAGMLYGTGDAAVFGGTSYIATTGTQGLEPDLYPAAWGVLAQGVAGPSGPAGATATVSVGTVSTGLPGTLATVTNSGTAGTAVLNFTIPQGAAGANGSGGGGSTGSVLSMYHAVTYSTNFYALNNTNANLNELATVMTWVPTACTATSLAVFSQQSNAVTVTLRNGNGTAATMANTALACVAASGSSCTVTGNVPVAAGSFLDLSIANASGTSAGVWTAVTCN